MDSEKKKKQGAKISGCMTRQQLAAAYGISTVTLWRKISYFPVLKFAVGRGILTPYAIELIKSKLGPFE